MLQGDVNELESALLSGGSVKLYDRGEPSGRYWVSTTFELDNLQLINAPALYASATVVAVVRRWFDKVLCRETHVIERPGTIIEAKPSLIEVREDLQDEGAATDYSYPETPAQLRFRVVAAHRDDPPRGKVYLEVLN